MPRRTDIYPVLGAGPIARSTPYPANPTRDQSEASYVQAL